MQRVIRSARSGFPRPYGQINGCCAPAPSVLVFDKTGKMLQSWGGPGDPSSWKRSAASRMVASGPRVSTASTLIRTTLFTSRATARPEIFMVSFLWAPNFGNDSQILKFKTDGTFVYQIGAAGAKGPNSNDTKWRRHGTPEPYWPADMAVDPKTNLMYIADGYGNRRVLIVDAATGKYVGHFGAYGQNPVVGENGGGEDVGEGAGSWPSDYKAGNLKPKFFRSPLHCAKLASDGLLYVCDRGNNRVQIFKASEVGKPCSNPEGEAGKMWFVGEIHVAPQTCRWHLGHRGTSPPTRSRAACTSPIWATT